MKKKVAGLAAALLLSLSLPVLAQETLEPGLLRHQSIVREQPRITWSESAKMPKEEWGIKVFSVAAQVQEFLAKRNLVLTGTVDSTQLLMKIK